MAKKKDQPAEYRPQEVLENGNLRVYCFDENGFYLGFGEARPDPLDIGSFLIPAYSTEIAPPNSKDGFHIAFNGESWGYIAVVEYVEPEKQQAETLGTDAYARILRDRALSDSDYTQLVDAPVGNAEAWRNYRKILRDLPNTSGWPDNISWPEKPTK